jgi:DNA polymerase-1
MKHRQVSKLLSSFIDPIPLLVNPKTGRVHTSFNQILKTGRYSSRNPNLQQLPRPMDKDDPEYEYSLRKAFVPEDGYVFVGQDASQIELRVIAVAAEETQMIYEFNHEMCPYSAVAATLIGMPYEEFMGLNKTDKNFYKGKRRLAKAVKLGTNYGMQMAKLKRYAKQNYGVDMTDEEAMQYYNKIFSLHPGLAKYHDRFRDKSILSVRNLEPFRRLRRWKEYPGIPQLCNFPIQSSATDAIKIALVEIYFKLHRMGYSPTQSQDIKLVLTVHDEVELECKEALAEVSNNILVTAMEKGINKILKGIIPGKVEGSIMLNLAEKE